jgi:hypothetical protein
MLFNGQILYKKMFRSTKIHILVPNNWIMKYVANSQIQPGTKTQKPGQCLTHETRFIWLNKAVTSCCLHSLLSLGYSECSNTIYIVEKLAKYCIFLQIFVIILTSDGPLLIARQPKSNLVCSRTGIKPHRWLVETLIDVIHTFWGVPVISPRNLQMAYGTGIFM